MTQKKVLSECCRRVDLFRISSLTLHWRIKKPQDIGIWWSQGRWRGRWKTIIKIVKCVKRWRDLKRGRIKTNDVLFETDILFK